MQITCFPRCHLTSFVSTHILFNVSMISVYILSVSYNIYIYIYQTSKFATALGNCRGFCRRKSIFSLMCVAKY